MNRKMNRLRFLQTLNYYSSLSDWVVPTSETIERCLKILSPRERYIIRKRFGELDMPSFEAIGDSMPRKLGGSRVRQIMMHGLSKLRKFCYHIEVDKQAPRGFGIPPTFLHSFVEPDEGVIGSLASLLLPDSIFKPLDKAGVKTINQLSTMRDEDILMIFAGSKLQVIKETLSNFDLDGREQMR